MVGLDLAVDLDQALDEDGLGLLEVQGVFQAVAEEDDERQALARLVRTRGGLGGPHARQLVKHPGGRGRDPLHVLPGATSHVCG